MPVAAGEALPSQVTTMPEAPLSTMATLLFAASPMMRSVLPLTVTVQAGHQRLSSPSRRRAAFLFGERWVRALRCQNMVSPQELGPDIRRLLSRCPVALAAPARPGSSGSIRCRIELEHRTAHARSL